MAGTPFNRRGTATLAGRMCSYNGNSHMCTLYARYAVSSAGVEPKPACGQHLSVLVRDVWRKFGLAAVVQEIPGMWRDDADVRARLESTNG
jgi:hypothetical protein